MKEPRNGISQLKILHDRILHNGDLLKIYNYKTNLEMKCSEWRSL